MNVVLTNDTKKRMLILYKLYNYINTLNINSEINDLIEKKYILFEKKIYDLLTKIRTFVMNDLCNINNYKKYRKIYKPSNLILKNNNFINKNIINYVNKNQKKSILLEYIVPFKNKFVKINIISYNNNKLTYYDNLINKILIAINLINNLFYNYNCNSKSLTITIYLIKINKQFSLTENNTNSGYTYPCIANGTITIFREEECLKVIIHELIHSFGYDKNYHFNKNINELLRENFNLNEKLNKNNSNIYFSESLVEFWAEYINICIFSHLMSNNYESFNKLVEQLMILEKINSINNGNNILLNNKLDYVKLVNFDKNLNNYKESSNIFSYYILKSYYIYDYKKIITANFLRDKIIINNENIIKIINFLIKISQSEKFLKFSKIINILKNNYLSTNENINFKKYFNMSFLDYK